MCLLFLFALRGKTCSAVSKYDLTYLCDSKKIRGLGGFYFYSDNEATSTGIMDIAYLIISEWWLEYDRYQLEH